MADEMGLGKTVCLIALVASRRRPSNDVDSQVPAPFIDYCNFSGHNDGGNGMYGARSSLYRRSRKSKRQAVSFGVLWQEGVAVPRLPLPHLPTR